MDTQLSWGTCKCHLSIHDFTHFVLSGVVGSAGAHRHREHRAKAGRTPWTGQPSIFLSLQLIQWMNEAERILYPSFGEVPFTKAQAVQLLGTSWGEVPGSGSFQPLKDSTSQDLQPLADPRRPILKFSVLHSMSGHCESEWTDSKEELMVGCGGVPATVLHACVYLTGRWRLNMSHHAAAVALKHTHPVMV